MPQDCGGCLEGTREDGLAIVRLLRRPIFSDRRLKPGFEHAVAVAKPAITGVMKEAWMLLACPVPVMREEYD